MAQKKKAKKRPLKAAARKRRQPPPVPLVGQFIGIHNSALANKARDTNIAESIKVRMKEEDTLTERQIEELRKIRSELLK